MGKVNSTSILSGLLIGIGVIANLCSQNNYIGAMLFSFALLTIIKKHLQLYTGQVGFIQEKRYQIKELINILIHNFLGVTIGVLPIFIKNSNNLNRMIEISNVKFSSTFFELFLYGFFCGILMLIAVYCNETIITIFCIMIFILSGYEHCIADFPFLLVNLSIENIAKFLMIILGNSLGAIFTYNLLIKVGDKNSKLFTESL